MCPPPPLFQLLWCWLQFMEVFPLFLFFVFFCFFFFWVASSIAAFGFGNIVKIQEPRQDGFPAFFPAVGEVLLLHSITMHKVWQEITVWQSCECFCEAFLARADPQTKAAWLIWYIVQFWYLSDIEIIYILQEKPSIIERAASEKTNNVICHIIHGRGENISDGNFHKSKLFVHINKSNQRLHNRKSK